MTDRLTAIARTRTYWDSLRIGGELPARADIDPRALPGALANTFLIERVAPGLTRFRIAGALASEVMGMDVRGMPFLSIIDPTERAALAPRIDEVFLAPSILNMTLESASGAGQARLQARLTLLPVRSTRGVDLALGSLETEGLVGRPPRRFRPIRTTFERILNVSGASRPEAAGFSEAPAEFTPARPTRPMLKLVHSAEHKVSGKDTLSE